MKSNHCQPGIMKVMGGEIPPQIGAMAENRTKLHETVFLKDMLPSHDVISVKKGGTVAGNNFGGNGGMLHMNGNCQIAEGCKSNHKRYDRHLEPAGRDYQLLAGF